MFGPVSFICRPRVHVEAALTRAARGVLCAALAAALLSCAGGPGSLDAIRSKGKIVFITRNSPTTYYEDRDGSMAGIEYDMATAFARYIGVEAEFVVIQTTSGILDALDRGAGDVAAAGLTHTPSRSGAFLVGPEYQKVKQLLVCRRGGARPRGLEDLAGLNLRVVAKSSYEEQLHRLKKNHPELTWTSDDSLDTEQLLREVWLGNIDCTVSDDNIFAINRRYYPELISRFKLSESEPLVWLFGRQSFQLRSAVVKWLEKFKVDGEMARLREKYFGYVEIFDYVDTRQFVRRAEGVLPRYRHLFEEASQQTGMRWTLLAAQAYQESHWDPTAQSPTGVEGIMMLTLPAAEDLSVGDRLNPEQSIKGGAEYLSRLHKRLPEAIEEPDRTWIALAAYNVGTAHLEDARILASRLKKDPDTWKGLSDVLPLLAQSKYYKSLEHGYARGSEPVLYVNRIRDYEDMLKRTLE